MLKISQSKTPIHTAGWRAPVRLAPPAATSQCSLAIHMLAVSACHKQIPQPTSSLHWSSLLCYMQCDKTLSHHVYAVLTGSHGLCMSTLQTVPVVMAWRIQHFATAAQHRHMTSVSSHFVPITDSTVNFLSLAVFGKALRCTYLHTMLLRYILRMSLDAQSHIPLVWGHSLDISSSTICLVMCSGCSPKVRLLPGQIS